MLIQGSNGVKPFQMNSHLNAVATIFEITTQNWIVTCPAIVWQSIRKTRRPVVAVYVLWVHSLWEPQVTPMMPSTVSTNAESLFGELIRV